MKKVYPSKPVLWLFTGLLALPLTGAAAGFQNGSFESPGLVGTFLDITVLSQAPTGWVPGGNLGNAALFYQATGSFVNVVAQSGTYLVGFGGNGRTGATLSQTFDTAPGTSYLVNYFTTAQQLGSGPQSLIAELLDGGNLVVASDSQTIPVSTVWANHAFSFVATTTTTTLRFTDTSNGAAAAGINWALDSVSVSTVPESGTFLGGVGVGWAALAGLRRHRR